jgi:hypothetical protein
MRSLGSRQPLLNMLEQSHQIRDVLVVDLSLRDLKGLNLEFKAFQEFLDWTGKKPSILNKRLSR